MSRQRCVPALRCSREWMPAARGVRFVAPGLQSRRTDRVNQCAIGLTRQTAPHSGHLRIRPPFRVSLTSCAGDQSHVGQRSGAGWGSSLMSNLRHEAKKGPARPGGGNRAGLATNSGVERRERYRRPRHRDQQIECRAQQNVTASSHRHVTCELSARARSFVVLVRAHVAGWGAQARPRGGRHVSPALTSVETSMRILAWSKSLRRR
jgi:hypothetical protein